MASPLYLALEGHLVNLRDHLLTLGIDYNQLTPGQLTRSLAFRVLASAAVEQFVEERCSQIANEGMQRFLANQPTRTGPALVVWFQARKPRGPLPLKEVEHIPDAAIVAAASTAYSQSVLQTHGIGPKDLQGHIWPLGLRNGDVDPILFDFLDAWSTQRDRTVHTRVTKVRAETTPDREWARVHNEIMPLLRELDERLDEVVTSF